MSLPVADHGKPPRLKTAIANLVWRITPTCREVIRLTSTQQDNALPFVTRFRLTLHRRFCVWCTRYAKQLGVMHKAIHQFESHLERTEPGLTSDQKAFLKRTLEAQAHHHD